MTTPESQDNPTPAEDESAEVQSAEDQPEYLRTLVDDEEDRNPPGWVRLVLILLAFGMLAGGVYLNQRQIKRRQQEARQQQQELVESVDTAPPAPPPADVYAWLGTYDASHSIAMRVPTPRGFGRMKVGGETFANWLRYLPLKPGEQPVTLHTGKARRNQQGQYAVVDIDTGSQDLQQAPDAVLRLWTEYLFSAGQWDRIRIPIDGGVLEWTRWAEGFRPEVQDGTLTWKQTDQADSSREAFRGFLDHAFAGFDTQTLTALAKPVKLDDIQPGDFFVHPGSPGHAVLVADVAIFAPSGETIMLLVQGGLPAQDIHLAANPRDETLSPWFAASGVSVIPMRGFTFTAAELMRFRQR